MRALYFCWRYLRQIGFSLDSAGSLSRLGTLRRAVSRLSVLPKVGGLVLIDYNIGKLESASKVWPNLSFLNPFEVRPCFSERILLFMSLFLRDSARRALQATGVAVTVRRVIQPGTTVCLWNPYSMFHFGVAEVVGSAEVALFTPEYPLPRAAKCVRGPEIIQSIYNLDASIFVPTLTEHTFVCNDALLAIYLTKLDVNQGSGSGWAEHRQIRRIENRLIAFGLEMWWRGVRTEFFLHSSDRSDEGLSQLPPEVRQLVNLGDSLQTLSRRQIGLSGVSTIGFQLTSLGIPHAFALTVAEGEHTPYLLWARGQGTVLDVDSPDDVWMTQLFRCFPEASHAVFQFPDDR